MQRNELLARLCVTWNTFGTPTPCVNIMEVGGVDSLHGTRTESSYLQGSEGRKNKYFNVWVCNFANVDVWLVRMMRK